MRSAISSAVLAVILLLGGPPPAAAGESARAMPGFTLAPSAKILLLRPRIKVGEQSAGGMLGRNAEWTELARTHITAALAAQQAQLGNQVITAEEPVGDDAQKLADYRALFTVLAGCVMDYQFFRGNRLPTKARNGVFDWTVGPEVKELPGAAGADYVLFISTEDMYGSSGRKAAQVFAAFEDVILSAGVHNGYAGLIDLKTGNLVWLNADGRMGGDVRTPDGAQQRVAQLLEGLPMRSTAPSAVAVAH